MPMLHPSLKGAKVQPREPQAVQARFGEECAINERPLE